MRVYLPKYSTVIGLWIHSNTKLYNVKGALGNDPARLYGLSQCPAVQDSESWNVLKPR